MAEKHYIEGRESLTIIKLSKQEAVDFVANLVATIADEALTGHSFVPAEIKVWDGATFVERIVVCVKNSQRKED
jgi:hypothetical protein